MNTNGNEHSWSSYKLRVDGTEITDIKSVKWEHEVEGVDPVYGASRKPRGRTAGRYKPGDASITFYKSGWAAFLATQSDGYADTEFTITEQWIEGSDVHTVTLENCRIIGGGSEAEEGTDAATSEKKISFLRAIEDGLELIADV